MRNSKNTSFFYLTLETSSTMYWRFSLGKNIMTLESLKYIFSSGASFSVFEYSNAILLGAGKARIILKKRSHGVGKLSTFITAGSQSNYINRRWCNAWLLLKSHTKRVFVFFRRSTSRMWSWRKKCARRRGSLVIYFCGGTIFIVVTSHYDQHIVEFFSIEEASGAKQLWNKKKTIKSWMIFHAVPGVVFLSRRRHSKAQNQATGVALKLKAFLIFNRLSNQNSNLLAFQAHDFIF